MNNWHRYYIDEGEIIYEIDYERSIIYIHSISVLGTSRRKGKATFMLKEFIKIHKGFDIALYSSEELGLLRSILDRWYKSLGFEEDNNYPLFKNFYKVNFILKNR